MRYCSAAKHFCKVSQFINSVNICNKCWYARKLRDQPGLACQMEFQRASLSRYVWFRVFEGQPVVMKHVTRRGDHELDMHTFAQRQSTGVLPLLDSTAGRDGVVMMFPFVDRLRFRELCSSKRLSSYFRSLCYVLRNLHAKNFVHGDIKPDNILVSRHSSQLFLADFGLSSKGNNAQWTKTNACVAGGTPGFRAPELLAGRGLSTAASDMWAVGITLLAFLRRRMPGPFSDRQEEQRFVHEVLYKARLQDHSLVGGRRGSMAALLLLKDLLREEASARLTAASCLEHPFLATALPLH